jgi:hypothetical protein
MSEPIPSAALLEREVRGAEPARLANPIWLSRSRKLNPGEKEPMALNLAVKEGSAVYIDSEPLRVITVSLPEDDRGWLVTVEKPDGSRCELSEDQKVEVFPGVYMHLGLKNQIGTASLVFEASPKVVILTEKNYRAFQAQSNR